MPGISIQFMGAAETVTGSQHIVSIGSKRLLVDCGLSQGKRLEADAINREFPFDPRTIDAVVLTHAHIDHTGNLPRLVKKGFSGPIYATPATRDLCAIMLADSAMIQHKDAEFLRKHGKSVAEPLYDMNDVASALELFATIPYKMNFSPLPGCGARFFDAGHLLGSSAVVLTLEHEGRVVRLAMGGDTGRKDRPILRSPEPLPEVEYIVSESTYGNRYHEQEGEVEETILRVINQTLQRNGQVLVPAFSVGRTQEFIYHLNAHFNAGRLPKIPIFVDSPLATSATEVFRMHPECFNPEVRSLLFTDDDPFGFPTLQYTPSVFQSKKIMHYRKPCVVVAGSGMCESGRILHHLYHGLGKAKNTVLILGFNAEHTLGRRLEEGAESVRILGDFRPVRARIEKISGLSAHADKAELTDYLKAARSPSLRRIFLVHGEPDAQQAFQEHLNENGFDDVVIPKKGQVFEL